MNFLPPNYQAPKPTSGYMKLEEGENRIRILSTAILGWEDWDEKKPIRYRFDDKPESSIDPKKPMKHFWSFIVWNYKAQGIQILHLTQASIRKRLEALSRDSEWGAPYAYDIKIYKTGEGVDTEYTVNPTPHKSLNPEIVEAFKARPIWLEALFDNEDPFAPSEHGELTPGFFDAEVPLAKTAPVSKKTKPVKQEEPIPLEATAEGQIDLETFLDFMPLALHEKQDQVQEFIQMCANASKQTVGAYMEKALEEQDRFVDCFTRWAAKTSQARKVS